MALGPGLDMLFASIITECVISGLVPLLRYRRDPVADRKYLMSSGDIISSSMTLIGPGSAGVFAERASAMPNLSITAFA